MEKIRIVTDSNSGIGQALGKELDITVIPMPFMVNGNEYLEDISMDIPTFFSLLENDDASISTSQPSSFYLEDLFKNILKEYDSIVYIPMSSGLSGTCENAIRIASKFDNKVFVVDNHRISVTQKESVLEAMAMVKKGYTASAIKEELEQTGKISSIYIVVPQIKYLKKGGRISPQAALIGQALRIKPILYTRGEKFEKFDTSITIKGAKKLMIDQIGREIQSEFNEEYESGRLVASVAHTQNVEEANHFKLEIISAFPKLKFHFVDPLSLSVSCHIGPGALAIALSVNNHLE